MAKLFTTLPRLAEKHAGVCDQ